MRERVLWNDLQVICGGGDEFHGGGAVEAGRENDCLVTRKMEMCWVLTVQPMKWHWCFFLITCHFIIGPL
jgi:hypothetical protein